MVRHVAAVVDNSAHTPIIALAEEVALQISDLIVDPSPENVESALKMAALDREIEEALDDIENWPDVFEPFGPGIDVPIEPEAFIADAEGTRFLAADAVSAFQGRLSAFLTREAMDVDQARRIDGAVDLLRANIVTQQWGSVERDYEYDWCFHGRADSALATYPFLELPLAIRNKRGFVEMEGDEVEEGEEPVWKRPARDVESL